MKFNQQAFLGAVIFFAVAFASSPDVQAEIFIGSNTSVNTLTVASNEAILISSIKIPLDVDGIQFHLDLNGTNLTNTTYDIKTYGQPRAVAGPATLSFPSNSGTNSVPVCLCFQRIHGTSIRSLAIPANTTNTLQVPTGMTCHILQQIDEFDPPLASIQVNSNTVSGLFIGGGEEFSGPATLTIGSQHDNFVSYYLTDDSVNVPNGVLQGPTGSFVITVEKSTDLIHWSPVIFQPTGNDQSAFYRLNFSH
ncbi:MAG TPA: hypothetical protein VIK53_01005 [Verrucomicrobiae bacterium]